MYKIDLTKPEHFSSILNIYKPFVIETAVSFEYKVPSSDEFFHRIKHTITNLPWIVCLLDKMVVGYAYASKYRQREAYQWSVEVSVYIDADYRRRNVATGLYTSLFSILELQNYKNLLAGISLPNEASVSFHESMGFRKIAEYDKIGYKFGKWHSVGWWQRSIGKKASPPGEIIKMPNLVNSPQFTIALKKGESVIND